MGLFGNGKPNVKALARRSDEDGLVAAAAYQDVIPAGDGAMVDRGAEIRQEAILALGALSDEAGAEAVKAAVADGSDAVRVAAVRVLYSREDASTLAAALSFLPREQGHARGLAIRALAQLRRPGSAPALVSALVHAHDDTPIDAVETTLLDILLEADGKSKVSAEAIEELLTALADERDAVAHRAEELLVLLAPASTEGVIAELKGGAAPYRAASVLARVKDTRALEPLMEALTHRDPRVRAQSAVALGELRDPAAVEALIHATRDPDHRVRAQAGSALDQLGMVALVVGVSTLVRPMILEAIAAAESRPALTEAQNGDADAENADGDAQNGDGEPKAAPASAATTPEALEQLLERMDETGVGPF